MKKWIYIILITLIYYQNIAQTAAANQGKNQNTIIYGQIGYAFYSALSSNGYILPSSAADIKLKPPSIIQNNITYTIFPNPTFGAVSIRLSSNEIINYLSIKLYDLQGRQINVPIQTNITASKAYVRLKLYDLKPATYLIQINVNNQKLNLKIIKQ